ncbi:MAG: GNAT family N-acetyltransferase [Nitrosomonadales bacterium]|jgi:acyl homoserine lactone synthase|nr:GNAT family N-acetyltransferase [Nitrosomonadales bacterium]
MSSIMLAQHGDGSLNRQAAMGMYRLRHDVFHDRLGWEVTSDNGMEHDEFDRANPVYVLVRGDGDEDENEVLGCWRLLPTTGPNMLKDTFPQLLHGQCAPQQADVWELSRFAVTAPKYESANYGFSAIPMRMMQKLFKFAQLNGIARYVTVTTVAVERLISKTGVNLSRFGPPIKIGRVLTVACSIEIDEITEFALFGTLPEHALRLAA